MIIAFFLNEIVIVKTPSNPPMRCKPCNGTGKDIGHRCRSYRGTGWMNGYPLPD